MVPVQAIVMIFGLSPGLAQLTITAGRGYSIFPGRHISRSPAFTVRLPLSPVSSAPIETFRLFPFLRSAFLRFSALWSPVFLLYFNFAFFLVSPSLSFPLRKSFPVETILSTPHCFGSSQISVPEPPASFWKPPPARLLRYSPPSPAGRHPPPAHWNFPHSTAFP